MIAVLQCGIRDGSDILVRELAIIGTLVTEIRRAIERIAVIKAKRVIDRILVIEIRHVTERITVIRSKHAPTPNNVPERKRVISIKRVRNQ